MNYAYSKEWPDTPEDLDSALSAVLDLDDVRTFDTTRVNYNDEISSACETFLRNGFRGGYVLIKTSTAGYRTQDHEVSTATLTRVLETACEVVPSNRVVLADGPAYDVSYQAECQRFGWAELAGRLGVKIDDLNTGPYREVAGGWPVSSRFLSADVVISLTRAKTHRRFGVSLGEKSLLGALSSAKLGHPKLLGKHRMVPWLLSIVGKASPPVLSIIDGMHGIEGDGPLKGTPTASHFICLGRTWIGADIRATIEMGFDPVLVPSYCRPFARVKHNDSYNWRQLRATRVDFLPSMSCGWLYKSLHRTRRRAAHFRALLQGARDCWPDMPETY